MIVAFADGHTKFLDEEIDSIIFGLLCSPHGAKTKFAGKNELLKDPKNPSGIREYATRKLKESDYLP